MIRIVASSEVCLMAGNALRRRALEYVINVAGNALQVGVCAGQRISGVLQVIELGVEPAVQAVAARAIGGELKPDVIDHRSAEILLMARIAVRGKTYELARGRLLVALLALDQGVRSDQGEPVTVILDRLERNLPALDRMALGAIGAKLAAVNVGVAVGALRADVLEHHTGVALNTVHVLVHPPQGIPGQVVIEFGIGTDGLPAGVTVAVSAGGGDRPVGIGHLGLGSDTYTDAGAGT